MERFEYRYVTNKDVEKTTEKNSVARSSDEVPEQVADPHQESFDDFKKSMARVLKSWSSQRDEYHMRLDRFADNAYPLELIAMHTHKH